MKLLSLASFPISIVYPRAEKSFEEKMCLLAFRQDLPQFFIYPSYS